MQNSQSKFASVFEKLDLKTAIRDVWWGGVPGGGSAPIYGGGGAKIWPHGAPPCPPLRETLPGLYFIGVYF